MILSYEQRCIMREATMAISFKGAHFPPEVILMGVRWYVAYPLSTRHVEELMEEWGVEVDHSTIKPTVCLSFDPCCITQPLVVSKPPPSILYRYANVRRQKDDPGLGATARRTTE